MSSCDGASFRILEGMVDFRRLHMSIWAGLSRFAHTGVVRQCRRASWQSAPDCLHFLSILHRSHVALDEPVSLWSSR